MILSKRVALGGVQLDGLNDWIVIKSIDPGVPRENISAVDTMGGVGQRVTMQHWQTLEVSVTYGIDIPKRSLALRRQIFDAVNAWALTKGWLTVNWLPGRRMWVDKVVLPGSGDLWNWTADFTIVFRAYRVPFWQDSTGTTVTATGVSSGNVTVTVGGMAETPLDVSFKNTSGSSCANISFSINGNTLAFNGINLAAGSTLAITHGTDGLLKAMVGSTSKYGIMTGGDDLWAKPGNNTLTVSASAAGELTITSYGRYI